MKIPTIKLLLLAFSLALTSFNGGMARAANGDVELVIMKADFIVGGSGGGGELIFEGVKYPLVVSGISIGPSAALSIARLSGVATNLKRPTDIAGTYTAVSAGAAVIVGVKSGISFKNENGVQLDLVGVEIGFDLSLDVSELAIAIR